jgi:hypothetical protein
MTALLAFAHFAPIAAAFPVAMWIARKVQEAVDSRGVRS